MTAKLRETWVTPVYEDDARNHWVMLSTAYVRTASVVRSLRLFSFEPSPALVEHQRSVLKAQLDADRVEVEVFALAADFFDAGEADIAGQ